MKIVYELPFLSQDILGNPLLQLQDDRAVLTISYSLDGEPENSLKVIFLDVHAIKYSGYVFSHADYLKAMDKIIQIRMSPWLSSLKSQQLPVDMYPTPKLKHLRLFFDEIGCYDVICSGLKDR